MFLYFTSFMLFLTIHAWIQTIFFQKEGSNDNYVCRKIHVGWVSDDDFFDNFTIGISRIRRIRSWPSISLDPRMQLTFILVLSNSFVFFLSL